MQGGRRGFSLFWHGCGCSSGHSLSHAACRCDQGEAMALTKQQHLDRAKAPKRILALDGGGIRGILTLEYLGVIENMLRKRSGRNDFLLCDYFDLIGGTSTGSIIAAALACGMAVDELRQLYHQIGASAFRGAPWRKGFLVPKYPSEPVQ